MRLFVLTSIMLFTFVFEGKTLTLPSQVVPYYGEEFYRAIQTGTQNEDLKDLIFDILTSSHNKNNNDFDTIGNCSGSNCYRQTSVGYNGARTLLFGDFYLVETGKGYGVKDLYCDMIKTDKDFPGKSGIGPNQIPNANIVNIEHTWPQSRFSGRHDKGTQKADMHHLFPTDSKLNSTRGNNELGDVVRDTQNFHCQTSARSGKGDKTNRDIFQPPASHKGNAARALFYFSTRYQLKISDAEEASLRAWSKEDPVDQEEIDRNDFIQKHQGNRNPFIDVPGLEDNIRDF